MSLNSIGCFLLLFTVSGCVWCSGFVLKRVLLLFSSSSDSNSSSSDGSRARSVQSTATHAPPAPPVLLLDSDEPRRSFGIRVQNLPTRSTGDRSLLASGSFNTSSVQSGIIDALFRVCSVVVGDGKHDLGFDI